MRNQELTFGEVRSMYFDDTALELPPVTLYRLDAKGSRHYFTINPDYDPDNEESTEPEFIFFSGVTTVTSSTLPKAEQLVKWIADMGYDNAIKYRDERAAYGTLMHTIFAHVLINGTIVLDEIDSLVSQYLRRDNLNFPVWKWADDIKQDVIAFAQWVKDYEVKPLAIEISLCSKILGIAGTADLPCLLTIPTKGEWGEVYKSGVNKGKPKETTKGVRTIAIVDFKSGRKSYGGDTACAAQLRLYKALWVENFGSPAPEGDYQNEVLHEVEGEAIRLFNWSPKDWRTNPGYHFPEQTESFSHDQMHAMIDMYRLSQKPIEEKTKTFYSGVVTLGEDPADTYKVKTSPELASERFADDTPMVESWSYLTVDQLEDEIERDSPSMLKAPEDDSH
jgi:hypothetical protein